METDYTISSLITGYSYTLRYRVRNFVGWSKYSPLISVLVATVPTAPAPV